MELVITGEEVHQAPPRPRKKFEAHVRHWPLPSRVVVEAADMGDALKHVLAMGPAKAEDVSLREIA
ncbi:MAG TPA: hypothetical protein VEA69_13345 [Tepidisphaeraceae bacterium]|nr:hypothetical protein [Tepidisphaeraceae bacterium]